MVLCLYRAQLPTAFGREEEQAAGGACKVRGLPNDWMFVMAQMFTAALAHVHDQARSKYDVRPALHP